MNHDDDQRDRYDVYDQYDRQAQYDRQDQYSEYNQYGQSRQCVTFRLPSHPRSVGRAREILQLSMDLPGDPGDTAALLLSELVTNALRHGSPPGREIGVSLHRADGTLRLEVEDAGDFLPRPRTPGPDDECGRGLALVDALADDWGVAPRRGPGKRVWVMLKVTDPPDRF
ncbi:MULTISPECIES: ATP-binding protein [unclassified Streptomyces]|uniref:ATP-binding protein n=1 Tax=unclassified Streptomyces TaxID=2593676 RepID=UPI00381B3EAE